MANNFTKLQQVAIAIMVMLAVLFSVRMGYGYYLERGAKAATIQIRTMDLCTDAAIALAKAESHRAPLNVIQDLETEVSNCAKRR